MKVLIAEDSEMYCRLLQAHLGRWGYEVITARDGHEAWEILQRPEAPRLAILDWIMPGLDGPEVCRRVREQAAEPYIYTLLLTGRDSRDDVVTGLQAGADDYVIKPFNAQELEVRVRAGKRIVDLQGELIAAREQLRIEASQDPLTGLLNRGAVMRIFSRDCARAQREQTPLSVLLADIDFFKKVNDTHGHGAGDAVLREVSTRMRQCLRPYDALARYGGEEFLVVLPACDRAGAVTVAERLRTRVNAGPVVLEAGTALAVSCSVGVGMVAAGGQATPAQLIEAADAALYRAKADGRNCVR